MSFWHKENGDIELLKTVALFDGFTDAEIKRVAELSEEREIASGTVLVDQGDAGADCFVIVEGSASVLVADHFVTSVSNGAIVGEMALVDHKPRNASVVASTDIKALRFDAQHFKQLLDEMPKAQERVMKILHDRLAP